MKTDDEYFAICNRAAEQFLKIPGVHSVGIGGRNRDGKPTGETVIKVFLVHKKPASDVLPDDLIPSEFEGVPTDVVECGYISKTAPPGGRARMTHVQLYQSRDMIRRRPLIGGGNLMAKRASAGNGTLGCLLDRTDDTTKVYALTNHHVLFGSGNAGVADTRVGQPTNKDSITGCCSDIFGTFKAGEDGAHVDAAIVQLDNGMQWKAEVAEIGVLKGCHTVTVAEASSGTYAVRKRGSTTRLTGGVVESIGNVSNSAGSTRYTISNGVVIRPNAVDGSPAATPFFCQSGDSGSVVVNNDNEVISLHFGTDYDATSAQHGFAFGIAIASVLTWFHGQGYATLKIATATNPGEVRKVGSARIALQPEVKPVIEAPAADIDIAADWGLPQPGFAHARVAIDVRERLEQDLATSKRGRYLRTLWLHHQNEVLALINTNKRVATVWHRSGAASLLQYLTNTLYDPGARVPREIAGRSVVECVDKLFAILRQYASDALRADMQVYRNALPDIGGKSYRQILDAMVGGEALLDWETP